jgi:predicted nucleic acid-binding protein
LIAVDTSSLCDYLKGVRDAHTAAIARAVAEGEAALPPIVVMETLSDPKVSQIAVRFTMSLPMIDLHEGYWARAGQLRSSLLSQGLHAATPDCLVAQCCIDQDVPLITTDRDFLRFVRAGLKLFVKEA